MPAARHQQENFPVASWLCPPALRPPILAIYRFARTADDLADEGQASGQARRQALQEMARQLDALPGHCAPENDWAAPLAQAMQAHRLPTALLHDLLSAFEQDTWMSDYPDRAALLDYCRRSANPIGRLMLHLAGVQDPEALQQSDAICTALQLINHWQDLSVDIRKPRLYLPLADLQRHGVDAQKVLQGQHSAALATCLAELTEWAVTLMEQGRPLPQQIGGRLGFELRLVMAGGLRVAQKIRAMQYATVLHRPRLRPWDAPLLLWRALRLPGAAS